MSALRHPSSRPCSTPATAAGASCLRLRSALARLALVLALGCGGTAGELFDEADASALAQAGRGSSLGGDGPVAEGGSGAGSAGGVGSGLTGTGAASGVAGAGGGGLGTGGAPA